VSDEGEIVEEYLFEGHPTGGCYVEEYPDEEFLDEEHFDEEAPADDQPIDGQAYEDPTQDAALFAVSAEESAPDEGAPAEALLPEGTEDTNEEPEGKEEITGKEDLTEAESPQQGAPTPSTPESFVDLASAMAINSDVVAWLYSPDTLIDYPVMKTSNYTYYIDHLPDGTVNSNGSLFIDYNNAWDFSRSLTIIYGHNMRSGKMLGSIPGYKSQSYYNNHPYMYIYTEHANYRLDIMYGFTISEKQFRESRFMYEQNVDALVSHAEAKTTFNSGVSYNPGDRVVALSTCTFEFVDARYVVLGILRNM
jgi:sortase B